MSKPNPYSNVPLPEIDAELKKPTLHEVKVEELAVKAKDIKPQRYDLTSKNTLANRVVHDFNKASVVIPPGETRRGVLLTPHMAEYLGKGDLTVSVSA